MISKDDHALIIVLRRKKNWSSQRLLRIFLREEFGQDKRGPAAEEN